MIIGFLENLLCMVSATRHRKRWLASIKLSKRELENRARKARFPDNPLPKEPYVAPPCGGTGNHSDPSWWEERLEDRIYEDDDESFGAQLNRSLRAKKLEREDTERAQEAIELRERLERGYRVHGWDKLERPVSIVEP